jgi:transcriptional regulator with XRE-family HTH domain
MSLRGTTDENDPHRLYPCSRDCSRRICVSCEIRVAMSVLQSVAVNLQKWRVRRHMSVSSLARAANVSKSTVSEIERFNGNPSLETLWALARALEIPLGFLFSDHDAGGGVRVVRRNEVPATFEQSGYISHLLAGWDVDGEIELYTTTIEDRASRSSDSHGAGVIEHAIVVGGHVRIQVADEFAEIGPGDLMSFPADQPHSYESIDGPVWIIGIHVYPRGRSRSARGDAHESDPG